MSTERPDLHARVAASRQQRSAGSARRVRREVLRRDGVRCELADGQGATRSLLNFCSNDYLGLSQHFAVVGAMQDAAARDGAGGVASHQVCGHHAIHGALERELADWLQVPRALLFGSGFAANLAVLQALLGDEDVCVQDRLNHASLIDGARLAGCHLRRYPHVDVEGALRQLRGVPDGAAILATDGVFSMDGDVAPLRELAIAARVQRALLYVDDAHGIGVLGPDGRGSVAAAGLDVAAVPLRLATLGKALGSAGAVVAGHADLLGHLAEAAAPLAAVKLPRREHGRRERLQELVQRFRACATRRGLQLLPSETPIQPLLCGDNARAMAMSESLEQAGYWVAAIRPPTVPEGQARLRVAFSAAHEPAQAEALADAIALARDRAEVAATRSA